MKLATREVAKVVPQLFLAHGGQEKAICRQALLVALSERDLQCTLVVVPGLSSVLCNRLSLKVDVVQRLEAALHVVMKVEMLCRSVLKGVVLQVFINHTLLVTDGQAQLDLVGQHGLTVFHLHVKVYG